ncbi:MAG TPA: phage tail sheath C-terminal domain-containing protein [Phycisphaerae bacterium]|nr:phage tail sheath C-terminal domain-containing protein [Phycisphaerae bacterium]
MPIAPTFPGVYVQELSSGVHTITGVSTSVTAFVGIAQRGPIEKPVHLLSFTDFERNFGGLSRSSDMSYAVSQFFLNGGSEAYAVRIANNPTSASLALKNKTGEVVLTLTAQDEGSAGNDVFVTVDYGVQNSEANFNLTLTRKPKEDPSNETVEAWLNLSMNINDARYVGTILQDSVLVTAAVTLPAAVAAGTGQTESGDLSNSGPLNKLIDDTHNRLGIALNGDDPVTVVLDPVAEDDLGKLAAGIQKNLQDALGAANVKVEADTSDNEKRLVITSLKAGESSTVRISAGVTQDVTARLQLGVMGGTDKDAVAVARPLETPLHGTVTSGVIANADLDQTPSAKKSMKVVLDGMLADIELSGADIPAGNLPDRLKAAAQMIQNAVVEAGKANFANVDSFKWFTAEADGGAGTLILRSGTRGSGSTIEIRPGSDGLSSALKLTAADGAEVKLAKAQDAPLSGGSELEVDMKQPYSAFIGDRSKHEGIYALEEVDLFNLMVLAGVSDPGVLSDAVAYCQERRAFLIVDSPVNQTIDEMQTLVRSAKLPKSNYGAVYYPWIGIADPLQGGRLRTVPPSGTIAGVYARTDSTRGVWKAPAGIEASLAGVQKVERPMTNPENGILNPRGVNCIRNFPVFGAVAWGARTLQGDDQFTSEWKYVPVRRLALYLEESLYRGTQWVVFEPNDAPLWAQIRLNINAFMQGLFRQGAFAGQTPKDAYFVRCDSTTTTQNDVDKGVVNIVVGFAPLKPAEFVIISFQQMAGQVQT